MSRATSISFLSVQIVAIFLAGCERRESADSNGSQKLQTIIIQDEKLEGSPKEIVAQLNRLAKKYDQPTQEGIAIRFDPAVDGECSSMSIFRGGEPLSNWLKAVCDSCGSKYRVDGTNIVIELVPLSEKRTANLETYLTNGIVELCREFRSKRGQDRFGLGEQIFRLLPQSPETSSKEVFSGTIVTYDYRSPSYKLYKKDVLVLLGEPDRNINNQRFCYSLRPTGDTYAELSVEFGEYDYAVNPFLYWK